MIIEVKNLVKIYKRPVKEKGLKGSVKAFFKRRVEKVKALKDISFSCRKGEIIGFVGPNGAGKTTTMKILSGVLFPTKGEVKVCGFIPWQREKEFLKKITFVMGMYGFLEEVVWDISPRDGFHFIKELYEIPDKVYRENLEDMISFLEVEEILESPLRKLSLGQKMKVELIASMLHEPEILFLDEPTLGLDIVSQKRIRDYVKKYVEERNATCILTSHYMRDVEDMTERLILIDKGEIIYDGATYGIIKKFNKNKFIEVEFSGKINEKEFKGFNFKKENNIYKFYLESEKVPEFTESLFRKFPVKDIKIEEPDLEYVLRNLWEKNSDK